MYTITVARVSGVGGIDVAVSSVKHGTITGIKLLSDEIVHTKPFATGTTTTKTFTYTAPNTTGTVTMTAKGSNPPHFIFVFETL
jgi:hypothetical protein